MPGTLYLGPDTTYASSHKSDILNAAIQLNPHARGQVATGSFTYNVYVSSLFSTTSITSASVRLYCGPTSNMLFPSWFANSRLVNEWTWGPTGTFEPCYPPPPVSNYTWDAVTDAQRHSPPVPTPLVWTPDPSLIVYNRPFSLIATLEYWVDGVKYSIGTGMAAKDPCAAVLCSLAFTASATPPSTGNAYAQNTSAAPRIGAAASLGLAGLGWIIDRRNKLRHESSILAELKDPTRRPKKSR